MMHYFLRKLLRLILVLLLVAAATFLLLNLLPGDVALALLGNEATPAAIAQVRAELGLDQPLVLRYLHWLIGFMHGDLGRGHTEHRRHRALGREAASPPVAASLRHHQPRQGCPLRRLQPGVALRHL